MYVGSWDNVKYFARLSFHVHSIWTVALRPESAHDPDLLGDNQSE